MGITLEKLLIAKEKLKNAEIDKPSEENSAKVSRVIRAAMKED